MGEYHPAQNLLNLIRKIMIGAGYLEVLNFILTNSEKEYDYMNLEKDESKLIQIANPVSKEFDTTRSTILHKLLDTLLFNRSEEKPIKIFEVGDVIILDEKEETGAKTEIHLAAVSYHEDANFTEMRSTLDYLMQSLNCGDAFEVKPGKKGTYING
ncbi:MAG: phenylalanine--tRNA ligase subunit beta, partial [Promethearchaeota archaeon]